MNTVVNTQLGGSPAWLLSFIMYLLYAPNFLLSTAKIRRLGGTTELLEERLRTVTCVALNPRHQRRRR